MSNHKNVENRVFCGNADSANQFDILNELQYFVRVVIRRVADDTQNC